MSNKSKNTPLFIEGEYSVTQAYIRTPRSNIDLSNVDLIEIRRPVFLMVSSTVVLVMALAGRFWGLLFWSEIFWLLTLSSAAAYASSIPAVLKVNSLSMTNEAVYGPIWRIRKIRAAVEQALIARETISAQEKIAGE